jgi:hypothetical protein
MTKIEYFNLIEELKEANSVQTTKTNSQEQEHQTMRQLVSVIRQCLIQTSTINISQLAIISMTETTDSIQPVPIM